MKESELKLAVAEYLQIGMNQGKWYSDRLNSGSALVKRGEKVYRVELCREGTADFMVLKLCGDNLLIGSCRVIFIELKGDKGKQKPEQYEFQKQVMGQGAEYYIIRSVDEIAEILEG